MLAPNLHRQRLVVEFYTDKNLYDTKTVELLLENFLYDLTAVLDMTIIVEPLIKTVSDGTSAYVMFAESGCSVHSWFEHKFVSVDLYSCRSYYVSDVLNVIDFWFKPTQLEVS